MPQRFVLIPAAPNAYQYWVNPAHVVAVRDGANADSCLVILINGEQLLSNQAPSTVVDLLGGSTGRKLVTDPD